MDPAYPDGYVGTTLIQGFAWKVLPASRLDKEEYGFLESQEHPVFDEPEWLASCEDDVLTEEETPPHPYPGWYVEPWNPPGRGWVWENEGDEAYHVVSIKADFAMGQHECTCR